jgi:hypothetical protein
MQHESTTRGGSRVRNRSTCAAPGLQLATTAAPGWGPVDA